jgi:hypothetical protein
VSLDTLAALVDVDVDGHRRIEVNFTNAHLELGLL